MKPAIKAQGYLILMTAVWGMTFPLLHRAIVTITPQQLVFQRFLLASLLLLPFVVKSLKKTDGLILIGGLILGLLNCGTYLFQTIGLETISASRAAFITGASVLFVPFLSPLFGLGKPKTIDFVSALICLFGLTILTGANLAAVTVGDIWVLGCAICVALTILTIQWLTQRMKHYLLLTFYQLLLTVPIAALFVHENYFTWQWRPEVWFTIFFCALFATVIALFIQIRFQHYTTATKAALIFTLEPVFASIFDWVLNGERLTLIAMIGGFFILLSIILPELFRHIKTCFFCTCPADRVISD